MNAFTEKREGFILTVDPQNQRRMSLESTFGHNNCLLQGGFRLFGRCHKTDLAQEAENFQIICNICRFKMRHHGKNVLQVVLTLATSDSAIFFQCMRRLKAIHPARQSLEVLKVIPIHQALQKRLSAQRSTTSSAPAP